MKRLFLFAVLVAGQVIADAGIASLCRRLVIESPRHFRMGAEKELPAGLRGVTISWIEAALGAKILSDRFEEAYRLTQSQGISFPEAAMRVLNLHIRLHGRERFQIDLARDRPVIFVATHPIGSLDGLMVERVVEELLPQREIRTVLTTYMRDQNIPGIDENHYIFVNPHDRKSSDNVEGVRRIMTLLKEQGTLIIFPAGDISTFDSERGVPVDRPWNPSFVSFAKKTNALIVPLKFPTLRNPRPFYWNAPGSLASVWRDAASPWSWMSHANTLVDIELSSVIDPTSDAWKELSAEEIATRIYRQVSP